MTVMDARFQQFEEDFRKKIREEGGIPMPKNRDVPEPSIAISQRPEPSGSASHDKTMKSNGGEGSSSEPNPEDLAINKSFEDTCTNLRIVARMKREIDDDRSRVNQGKFSTFIRPMSGIAKPSGFNSRSTRNFSKKSQGQKSGSRLSYFQKRQGQKSHVEGSQQSRRETAMSAPSVNGPCPKCGKSHGGQCWQCYKCHQYGHTVRYCPELQQQTNQSLKGIDVIIGDSSRAGPSGKTSEA
ncbi:hypothetical protein K1719_032619 [Acacia pycnantha]|nr:hypothetical protein K1719_032619 [Acacia pycnantha]